MIRFPQNLLQAKLAQLSQPTVLSFSGETTPTINENLLPVDTVGSDFSQDPQVLKYSVWIVTFGGGGCPTSNSAYVFALKLSVDFPVTMITSSSNCFSGRKSSHTTVDKHNRLKDQKTTEGRFSSSKTFLY